MRDCVMQLIMEIPDELGDELKKSFTDVGRAALEALAAEAYEQGVLTGRQIRHLLGLGSRRETQKLLSRHGVWTGISANDVLSDMKNASDAAIPRT